MPKDTEQTGNPQPIDVSRMLRLLLLLMFLASGSFFPARACAQLSDYLQIPQDYPARDIIVVSGGGGVAWKKLWDDARHSWREGNYSAAEESYRQLLAGNDNIAEARWELAQVLIRTGQWEKARRELETLAELPHPRLEYLTSLGLVMRHQGQFGRALELFDKAHALYPDNFLALAGLTQGLAEVGRKKEAFPFFQEIVSRKPNDRNLHLAFANLAFELGRLETAREQLLPLAAAKNAKLDTLLLTGRVLEGLGRDREAVGYWKRCLLVAPDNREVQGRLALYYENRGKSAKALDHLLVLLKLNPQNPSLLSRICLIYVKSGRYAEALPYYARFVKVVINGTRIGLLPPAKQSKGQSEELVNFIKGLLAISPNDLKAMKKLAAAMEAGGKDQAALNLWALAARVVPDNVDIYGEMAALLEKMGRREQLAEVLETIARLNPGDIKVVSRLARLQAARGKLESSLGWYKKLQQEGYSGPDIFAERAHIYLEKKQPTKALGDLLNLLKLSPGQDDVRRQCVSLAGELGDEQILNQLAGEMEGLSPPGMGGQDLLLLAEAYARTGDVYRAAVYFRRVMNGSAGSDNAGREVNSPLVHRARLGLAELYLEAGLVDEAEQTLRQGLLAGGRRYDYLTRLADLALSLDPPDLASAAAWLAGYNPGKRGGSGEVSLRQARLLAAEGKYLLAENILAPLLSESMGGASREAAKPENLLRREAGLSLAEILQKAGRPGDAEKQCRKMLKEKRDQEVMVLLQKIYQQSGKHESATKLHRQLLAAVDADPIRLLRLARLYERCGLAADQAAAAGLAFAKHNDSLRAGLLQARAVYKQGDLEHALKLTLELEEKFPDSIAISAMLAQLYYKVGGYRSAVRQSDHVLEEEPDRLDIVFLKLRSQLARGDLSAAQKLVQKIFPEAPERSFLKELQEDKLSMPDNQERRNLWQVLTFTVSSHDYLGKILQPKTFMADSDENGVRLRLLANNYLPRYRWARRFRALLDEN